MNKFKIIWSSESKRDLRKIKNNLSKSTLKNISIAPRQQDKLFFLNNFKLMNIEKIVEE